MKKAILIRLFLLLYIIVSLSCRSSSLVTLNNVPADSNQERIVSNNHIRPSDNLNNSIDNRAQPKTDLFFVILGSASVEKNKIELDGNFWGHFIDDDNAETSRKNEIEIDIMNCAGYIASATTTYKMKNGMREVKIINETIASNAAQKIKQCSIENNGEIFVCDVFGITPRDGKRKNTQIGKVDTKKLYDSLVRDIREIKKIEKPEDDITPQLKGTKGSLSLGEDNWTDLDGDGQIDLIEFHDTPCDEKDTCTWIFRLIDGKWKNIDYVSPL